MNAVSSYVIIDEAQDLTGSRTKLPPALIAALCPDADLSIFVGKAQAT